MQENGSAPGNDRRSSGGSCLSRCRAVGERSSDRARWRGGCRRRGVHRRQRRGERWNDGRNEHRRGWRQRAEPGVAEFGRPQRDAGAAGPQRRESRHRRAGAGRSRARTRRRPGRATAIKQRSNGLRRWPSRSGTVQSTHRARWRRADARHRHLGGAERDAGGRNGHAGRYRERGGRAQRRRSYRDLRQDRTAAQERSGQRDRREMRPERHCFHHHQVETVEASSLWRQASILRAVRRIPRWFAPTHTSVWWPLTVWTQASPAPRRSGGRAASCEST
jgi:hypothetical protein